MKIESSLVYRACLLLEDPSERTLNDDFFDATIWRGDTRSKSLYCALDGSLPVGRHNFSVLVDGEEDSVDGFGFAKYVSNQILLEFFHVPLLAAHRARIVA